MKKSQPKKTVDAIIEFGEVLMEALHSENRGEAVPKIEDKVNEVVDSLSPQELGFLGMTCVLLLSKIAYCKPSDAEGNIKTAVVSCRAIVNAIDQSGKSFSMDSFDISTHMCLEPLFKPSAEQIKDALLTKSFEDMDPAGEC